MSSKTNCTSSMSDISSEEKIKCVKVQAKEPKESKRPRENRGLIYKLNDVPSWYLSFLFGFQVS